MFFVQRDPPGEKKMLTKHDFCPGGSPWNALVDGPCASLLKSDVSFLRTGKKAKNDLSMSTVFALCALTQEYHSPTLHISVELPQPLHAPKSLPFGSRGSTFGNPRGTRLAAWLGTCRVLDFSV